MIWPADWTADSLTAGIKKKYLSFVFDKFYSLEFIRTSRSSTIFPLIQIGTFEVSNWFRVYKLWTIISEFFLPSHGSILTAVKNVQKSEQMISTLSAGSAFDFLFGLKLFFLTSINFSVSFLSVFTKNVLLRLQIFNLTDKYTKNGMCDRVFERKIPYDRQFGAWFSSLLYVSLVLNF